VYTIEELVEDGFGLTSLKIGKLTLAKK